MGYQHFTKVDRRELSILLNKGYSYRDIGQALKKDPSSISREVRKRSDSKGNYDPDKADHKAYVKRKYSKYQGMKVRDDPELESYVQDKLQAHWTPEEISGRLKEIDTRITYVSPHGIYKYLYSQYGQPWCIYLFSRRYRKKKRETKKKTAREIIKNRISIEKRDALVNRRERYGDWEGDTLGAIKSDKARIGGLVERKSRYFLAFKVRRLKYTMDGFKKYLNPYHHIVHSLTLDNGVENARHQELDIKTYFCHPYSSWEKPTIENTFLRLRRFIPKKSSIKNIRQKDIQAYTAIMNNTPRKCLNFRTPKEVYEQQLFMHRCCT
jgi:IS30 family transposase